MKGYLIAIIVSINLFMILLKLLEKHEVVHKTEGNIVFFENGNWAKIYGYNEYRDKVYNEEQRYYEKFSFDSAKIGDGAYIDGKFIPNKNPSESIFSVLIALDLVLVVSYCIFFLMDDMVLFRDWLNSKNEVALTAMPSMALKKVLTGKMACERCNTSPDFIIDKETRVQGMIFIEGRCNICGESKKVRLK